MTVIEEFAAFAAEQGHRPLEDELAHDAARAVLDWFSATVPGAEMAPATLLRAALLARDEHGSARLVGDRRATSARTAALINATASHTAELDDIYRDGIYHPGSPTVAASLAAADVAGVSGEKLLQAVIVGYEVGDRVAAAINPAHYRFWHTTGTVGSLGSAAAAGVILGLDATEMAHTLANATTMAAGLQQAFRSDAMSKPLHAGHAAESGLLAAIAAQHGFTGALDVLEGDAGFGAAMSDAPDWRKATDELGKRFCIADATVKNHSCCGHTFAAVDAMSDLRSAGLSPDDVKRITIATYTTALKVAGNPAPATAFEAKFSLSYCAAAELALGGVRLRAFQDDALGDKVIRHLMDQTSLQVDPNYDELFPQQRAARVTITDRSGADHVSIRLTRKGDPDDPLTDDELQAKFDELVEPSLGIERAARLSDSIWSLSELRNVAELPLGTDRL